MCTMYSELDDSHIRGFPNLQLSLRSNHDKRKLTKDTEAIFEINFIPNFQIVKKTHRINSDGTRFVVRCLQTRDINKTNATATFQTHELRSC